MNDESGFGRQDTVQTQQIWLLRLVKGKNLAKVKAWNLLLGDRLLPTDVCVPISSLPEVVLAAKEDILRSLCQIISQNFKSLFKEMA